MPLFSVVLHGKGENEKDSYFTNGNEIVDNERRAGSWSDFQQASKAAMRARLQDPFNRKVTVADH